MSRIAAFRAAERALAQQVAEFEALKNEPELKKEIEFDNALNEFLTTHNSSRVKLLAFLQQDEESSAPRTPRSATKKPRKSIDHPERVFKNPHTGETVKVRSLNHGTIRDWSEQYGKEEVRSWEKTGK